MRKILICFLLCYSFTAFSQKYKWEPIVPGIDCVDSGVNTCGVTGLLFDSLNNQLYVAGEFDSVEGKHVYGMARWNGTNWNDIYGMALGGQRMCKYGKEVAVTKNGEVYYFDSTGFTGIGQANDDIYALETYHGELYVAGRFSKIGNKSFNHIASWDGVQWNDVGGGVTGLSSVIYALKVFKGKLYVGGLFDTAGIIGTWNVAVWNGFNWQSAGVGGGTNTQDNNRYAASVDVFGIYNNVLFIAGDFDYINNIKTSRLAYSFDGQNWQGANYPSGSIRALKQWNDKFFIGQAGTPYIYQYDGINYIVPDSGFNNSVSSLEVCKNELYCGGEFWKSGNTNIFRIAKLTLDTSLIVTEIKKKEGFTKIYPSPNDGSFAIVIQNNSEKQSTYTLRVTDFIGRTYLEKRSNIGAKGSVTVPANIDLPQGIYLINVRIGNEYYSTKFVTMQ